MQAEKAAFEEAEKKREEEVIIDLFFVLIYFLFHNKFSLFFFLTTYSTISSLRHQCQTDMQIKQFLATDRWEVCTTCPSPPL